MMTTLTTSTAVTALMGGEIGQTTGEAAVQTVGETTAQTTERMASQTAGGTAQTGKGTALIAEWTTMTVGRTADGHTVGGIAAQTAGKTTVTVVGTVPRTTALAIDAAHGRLIASVAGWTAHPVADARLVTALPLHVTARPRLAPAARYGRSTKPASAQC